MTALLENIIASRINGEIIDTAPEIRDIVVSWIIRHDPVEILRHVRKCINLRLRNNMMRSSLPTLTAQPTHNTCPIPNELILSCTPTPSHLFCAIDDEKICSYITKYAENDPDDYIWSITSTNSFPIWKQKLIYIWMEFHPEWEPETLKDANNPDEKDEKKYLPSS